MFEHLTDSKEVFRNKVIDVNNELYVISENFIKQSMFYLNEDDFKIKKMKEFLEAQDKLNLLFLNNF